MCDPLSPSLMDKSCVLKQECSHRPPQKNPYITNRERKKNFLIYQLLFYEDITLVECVE